MIEVTLSDLLTSDPVPFSVRCAISLRFTPGRESIFLSNFMSGKDALTVDDLNELVYAELKEGALEWAGKHNIKELAEDLSLTGRPRHDAGIQHALGAGPLWAYLRTPGGQGVHV